MSIFGIIMFISNFFSIYRIYISYVYFEKLIKIKKCNFKYFIFIFSIEILIEKMKKEKVLNCYYTLLDFTAYY